MNVLLDLADFLVVFTSVCVRFFMKLFVIKNRQNMIDYSWIKIFNVFNGRNNWWILLNFHELFLATTEIPEIYKSAKFNKNPQTAFAKTKIFQVDSENSWKNCLLFFSGQSLQNCRSGIQLTPIFRLKPAAENEKKGFFFCFFGDFSIAGCAPDRWKVVRQSHIFISDKADQSL